MRAACNMERNIRTRSRGLTDVGTDSHSNSLCDLSGSVDRMLLAVLNMLDRLGQRMPGSCLTSSSMWSTGSGICCLVKLRTVCDWSDASAERQMWRSGQSDWRGGHRHTHIGVPSTPAIGPTGDVLGHRDRP